MRLLRVVRPAASSPYLRARRALGLSIATAALPLTLSLPADASAAPKPPKLTALRCVPVTAAACKAGVKVQVGDAVALRGKRLVRGQRVTFRWKKGTRTAKVVRVRGAAHAVRVPKGTPVGTVTLSVKDKRGRRSNRLKLKVVALPSTTVSPATPTSGPAVGRTPVPAAFEGTGLWIFNLVEADGGDPAAIASRARGIGASAVLVKSADGTTSQGSQFSRGLVDALHAGGVKHVCAWQYVYGNDPAGEAAQAIASIRAGADCFVINAEHEYAGRYGSAQAYLAAVRAAVGRDYPLGFSSYVDPTSNPGVPYSVFLGGPDAAQVAMPQVYWQDAGDRPVAAHSQLAAAGWAIYGRPIVPMGQLYNGATADDLQQFRPIWRDYGARGLSLYGWGDRKETILQDVWDVLATPAPKLDPAATDFEWQRFAQGTSGNGVAWVQQLLRSVDPAVEPDGVFGPGTDAALRRFQISRGLDSTGGTGPATWRALLELTPAPIDWTARPAPR